MPIIQSAKKRARQAKVREARNKVTKKNMRSAIKELMVDAKDGGKNAAELFKKVQSTIDTAVKKNLIHKNAAARKKSRLNADLKKLKINPQGSKSAKKKAAPKVDSKPTAKTTTKAPAKKKAAPKKVPAKKPAAKK
jgi:small subunit ribosomal protein S20